MIEVSVPTEKSVKAIATVVGYITDGLDAVVVGQVASLKKPGEMVLTIAGNPRDLELARERAERLK